jgi:hypothetical protein
MINSSYHGLEIPLVALADLQKNSAKCQAKSLCVFEEKHIDSFLASHISWTSFFNFIRTNPISSFGRPRFGGEAMTRIIW